MQAKFIVIEGLEGAGKSTVIKHVGDYFSQQKIPYIMTREPGGTELAEGIRDLIKRDYDEQVHAATEVLLLYAARLQLVENVIKPALCKNTWVIGDRHDLSTIAYQSGGRGIDQQLIANIKNAVLGDFSFDLCLYLDIEPEIGLQRASNRGRLDRIEREDIEFFSRIRAKYLELACSANNIAIVNANQDVDQVKHDVLNILQQKLFN